MTRARGSHMLIHHLSAAASEPKTLGGAAPGFRRVDRVRACGRDRLIRVPLVPVEHVLKLIGVMQRRID